MLQAVPKCTGSVKIEITIREARALLAVLNEAPSSPADLTLLRADLLELLTPFKGKNQER